MGVLEEVGDVEAEVEEDGGGALVGHGIGDAEAEGTDFQTKAGRESRQEVA